MRKSILSLATVAALAVPAVAAAQTPAPAPSPITGNMSLVSDYRFRGITQTFEGPALQGGFDYAHSSGVYLGNWNSNVNEGAGFPGSSLEMDFYGGWKKSFGDFGLDVGFIWYFYPGSEASATTLHSPANNRTGQVASGSVDNKEIYIGGSWKFLSLKYYHSIDDYFSAPDTKNSSYLDFGITWDLGSGWGLVGHVGSLKFKNMDNADYTDWKVGVTKDLGGYVFGLTYVDTNAKGNCGSAQFYCFTNGTYDTASGTPNKSKDAGDGALVLSVMKTF